LVTALEAETLAGLGRRRQRKRQFLEDASDLRDLLPIVAGQLALADVQTVFEADAQLMMTLLFSFKR